MQYFINLLRLNYLKQFYKRQIVMMVSAIYFFFNLKAKEKALCLLNAQTPNQSPDQTFNLTLMSIQVKGPTEEWRRRVEAENQQI